MIPGITPAMITRQVGGGGGPIQFVGYSLTYNNGAHYAYVDFSDLTGGTLQVGDYALVLAMRRGSFGRSTNFQGDWEGKNEISPNAFGSFPSMITAGVAGVFYAGGMNTDVEYSGNSNSTEIAISMALVFRGVSEMAPISLQYNNERKSASPVPPPAIITPGQATIVVGMAGVAHADDPNSPVSDAILPPGVAGWDNVSLWDEGRNHGATMNAAYSTDFNGSLTPLKMIGGYSDQDEAEALGITITLNPSP